MTFYEITQQDQALIEAALQKLDAHYDGEHYRHTVGSAVRCADGRVFAGVNCDGIHGSCAEYIAIGSAISQGGCHFDTIVAVHRQFPNQVIPPCGNYRQMMIEYCPDIKVLLNNDEGQLVKVGIRDLLPFACP